MSVIVPLLEIASSLPQNAPQPKLPEPLECLEWADCVDKWGLLNPGTYLDQPKWFMEDIKAASSGRIKWRRAQIKQESVDIPSIAPGITR